MVPEFALGYYKFGSHELLPVEECPVSSPLINRAIAAFWRMGRGHSIPDGIREIEFFANADDTHLLIEASCELGTPSTPVREWAAPLPSALPEVAGILVFRAKLSTAIGTAEPKQISASGMRDLIYKTHDVSYRVSAGAFFQVNRYLINELVKIVTEGHAGEMALDLYAGVGTFLLRIVPKICTGDCG